jgi:hypothetical protein
LLFQRFYAQFSAPDTQNYQFFRGIKTVNGHTPYGLSAFPFDGLAAAACSSLNPRLFGPGPDSPPQSGFGPDLAPA